MGSATNLSCMQLHLATNIRQVYEIACQNITSTSIVSSISLAFQKIKSTSIVSSISLPAPNTSLMPYYKDL